MDPDQSQDAQNAQACLPSVQVSQPAAEEAPPPVVAAPGPAESAGQDANPILASAGGDSASGEQDEGEASPAEVARTGVGALHTAADFGEGAEATAKAVETGEESVQELNTINAFVPKGAELAIAPEVAAAAEGAPNFAQTVEASEEVASAGKVTFGNVLAPVALASDTAELVDAGKDIADNGANLDNVPKAVKAGAGATSAGIGTLGLGGAVATSAGAAETGAAMTAAAAAAAPVAAGAAGLSGGLGLGAGMGATADSEYAKGWGDDGKMTAMEYGASWGTTVDSTFGDKNPDHKSIAGGVAAGAGGIVMGTIGAVQGAGNWLRKEVGSDRPPNLGPQVESADPF